MAFTDMVVAGTCMHYRCQGFMTIVANIDGNYTVLVSIPFKPFFSLFEQHGLGYTNLSGGGGG